MKIYTKTGDKGQTALYGGTRISKSSARVEAYGTVDELNSFVGMAKSAIQNEKLIGQLKKIQFDLFTLGAEVATPEDKLMLANGKSRLPLVIEHQDIEKLENWIDDWEQILQPLQFFILPAGDHASATLHVCRTVTRRAERALVFVNENENSRPELLQYLNRLSDYFFVVARVIAQKNGTAEEYWNPAERPE